MKDHTKEIINRTNIEPDPESSAAANLLMVVAFILFVVVLVKW